MLAASGIAFCADARVIGPRAPTLSAAARWRGARPAFNAVDLSCRYLLQRCNAAAATKLAPRIINASPMTLIRKRYPVAQAEKRAVELGQRLAAAPRCFRCWRGGEVSKRAQRHGDIARAGGRGAGMVRRIVHQRQCFRHNPRVMKAATMARSGYDVHVFAWLEAI